jgi:opacity protein-like surface antigen
MENEVRHSAYLILAASASLTAATSVRAEDAAGHKSSGSIYLGGFVGDRFGRHQTISGANPAGQPRVIETTAKDGLLGGASIGAVVADGGWGRARVEAELTSSRVNLANLSLNSQRRELLQGRRSVATQMVNIVYDTPRIADRVRLSLGGGVGHGAIDYDTRYLVAATGPEINIPTSVSGKIAFQGIAGASIAISRGIELTTDVRYTRIGQHEVERFNATAGTLDSVLSTRYSSVVGTAGFRFFF